MLGPTTVFVVTITVIRSFQVFDTVEAIFPDSGGPGKTAYVMMFAIYEKGIKQNLLGTGAAITKSSTYLVYCRSGNRSSQVSALMTERLGFKDVKNLLGGYQAWAKQ